MKILLWVLVALAVAVWLTHGKKKQVKASRNAPEAPPADSIETMVCCAHCGTYVPASEAVSSSGGLTFCSEEHRLRHSQPDSPA